LWKSQKEKNRLKTVSSREMGGMAEYVDNSFAYIFQSTCGIWI